ncbi:hypothetical protein P4U97_21900 [Bacillus swezeyi]|uniref:hypothetical protein n=1 Tax=Bacillus swezeyi TaxID=1925020 RepID=UPI002E1E7F58|nr:hypothetical protein [Bacillus swezeyi]
MSNSKEFVVDIKRSMTPFLNSLALTLEKDRKNTENELTKAKTFWGRIFNRKKISQLQDQVELYNYCEQQIKSNEFRNRLDSLKITVDPDSPINIEFIGNQLESTVDSYFKKKSKDLFQVNSLETFDELNRLQVNFDTFSALRGQDFSKKLESEKSLISFLSTENEWQTHVSDYRETNAVFQFWPDQYTEGMLDEESQKYINEYKKHLTLHAPNNHSFFKQEKPNYSLIREIEGTIRNNFSKDPDYAVIAIRSIAAENLKKELEHAVDLTNSYVSDFNGERLTLDKDILMSTLGNEAVTYEKYSMDKKSYKENMLQDNIEMEQTEKGLDRIKLDIGLNHSNNAENQKQIITVAAKPSRAHAVKNNRLAR